VRCAPRSILSGAPRGEGITLPTNETFRCATTTSELADGSSAGEADGGAGSKGDELELGIIVAADATKRVLVVAVAAIALAAPFVPARQTIDREIVTIVCASNRLLCPKHGAFGRDDRADGHPRRRGSSRLTSRTAVSMSSKPLHFAAWFAA
jgi:hypothetical protein